MATIKTITKREKFPIENRKEAFTYYYNKYFNLFMNSYLFEGIDYQQSDYLMRRFWSDGKVSAYLNKKTIGSTKYPQGQLIFTQYAPINYNIYDYPVDVTLINKRGVSFIPGTPQQVDKDVVLGYCQRNKKSVSQMVEYYVNKIVDIEMVIKLNLQAHKTPFLIGVNPESKARMEALWNNIQDDNPKLFVELEDVQNVNTLITGSPYIIDKLFEYKCGLENELKEYLGINNMGVTEKKEHLISTEVEANNEIVANSGDCFYDVISDFCKRIQEVFGYPISVIMNKAMPTTESGDEDDEQDKEDDEDVRND